MCVLLATMGVLLLPLLLLLGGRGCQAGIGRWGGAGGGGRGHRTAGNLDEDKRTRGGGTLALCRLVTAVIHAALVACVH
jgi:hypothetical protein